MKLELVDVNSVARGRQGVAVRGEATRLQVRNQLHPKAVAFRENE